jgi:GNAT superfamily N-acetyltransferase
LDFKFDVRFSRPGDESEIVELLELVFDGWPHLYIECTSLDHWIWKYYDNPIKATYVRIATSGDKIIGCAGNVITRIKIGERVLIGAQGVDFAVHQDYRSRGVLTKMGELFDELVARYDVSLNYGFESNPILIERSRRRGFPVFPHPITNLVRIKDIDLQLKHMPVERPWLMRSGFFTFKTINRIKNLFRKKIPTPDIQVKPVDRFDDNADEFWRETSDQYNFIVERGKKYLNWRYLDPRAGGYVARKVEEGDHLLGYSVLKVNRYLGEYLVGYIVDLLTLPNRQDVAEALALDAVTYFDQNNVNIVNFLVVKGHPNEEILKSHGFLDSRFNFYMFLNFIKDADVMRDIENSSTKSTFISWGDHDSLPVSMPRY